ncbi:hypothetical protein F4802DRAFT_581924, partial [Xylaria palmicola]
MDEKRPSGIAAPARGVSGIPKPSSRLALPRSSIPTPTSTARSQQTPAPSADTPRASLTQGSTAGTLRQPRLRSTTSRDPIGQSATLPRSYKSPIPSQSAADNRGSRSVASRPLHSQPASTDGTFKKPLVPRRRPSSHFSHGTQSSGALAGSLPSGDGATEDAPELPPLAKPAADNLTFDTLLMESRKPMPSLAERTMETLARLPSSPAMKSRGANFFDVPASRRAQSKDRAASRSGSRPGSSYQSDGSNGHSGGQLSRPGSSSSSLDKGYTSFRASTSSYKPPLATVQGTPSKRLSTFTSSIATLNPKSTPKLTHRPSLNNVSSRASLAASMGPRTPNPEKHAATPVSKYASKTLAVRPLKTRGSVNGLFKRPSTSSLRSDQPTSDLAPGPVRKASLASVKSSGTYGGSRNVSSPSTTSTAPTVHSLEEPPSFPHKSSAALRDQIAKAKAAKRAASRQVSATMTSEASASSVIPQGDDTFDFEVSDDPFGQKTFEDSNRKVLQSRIDTARVTGRLNIAAMGLKDIPDEVLNMYDLESIGRADGTWAESVDLTRLVAADNELETIDDSIFPDVDPSNFESEEVDEKGRMFWGLESADLHNNRLISLPLGFRRLQQVTSLNLTSNKLTNSCIEIIAQCSSLRDLKLGNNVLSGSVDDLFILENLEILDIHGNAVSSLSPSIDRMRRLRILNLDENSLASLPFQSLSALPLSELHVRKNKLTGTLIEPEVESLSQLQILDCSGNQLSYLISPDAKQQQQQLNLPSLHQLTVSMNRLKILPDMSSWGSILTINADDNSISAFPDGFTSRHTLKHAGFSSNDIRTVPPEIARMEDLAMLRITGNPLRDKKFTSLTTEELKDALLARLEPLPSDEAGGVENFANGIDSIGATRFGAPSITSTTPAGYGDDGDDEDAHSESDNFATPPTSAPHSPVRPRSRTMSSQTWPVKSGGILDRSNTESSSLHPVVCSKIAAAHSVREVRLQHNTFTRFPNSLSFFSDTLTSLSISHNQLTGESWLTERLDLTALRELNMQSNFCTSLTPLMTHLCAPSLEKLDVSLNRIVQIPTLRDVFPNLTILLMANNRLEGLDPDTIQGMKIVDGSNNEIAHLNPRIGLLGLERLDVMGNRFRVPRWNVLERGTEATLRWLRGRVPVAEMAEWRARNGAVEDDSANEA